jgi:hypothetical protein
MGASPARDLPGLFVTVAQHLANRSVDQVGPRAGKILVDLVVIRHRRTIPARSGRFWGIDKERVPSKTNVVALQSFPWVCLDGGNRPPAAYFQSSR